MFRVAARLGSWVVLTGLCLACFARLLLNPGSLIVDPDRPSVDHANRLENRPIGNDATFLFLPHHQYVAKCLAEYGHVPRWDASAFGGRPMVGNPQSSLFYPPVWIAWIWPQPAVLGWITVGHLVWGSWGVFFLARREGVGRWSATVAAGTFQAAPYLMGHLFEGHYPHLWSVCWFPWAFLGFAELRTRPLGGVLILSPVLALSYLAGHPQEWFLLVTALSGWVFVEGGRWLVRRRPREAVVLWLGWASAVGGAVGLAAVELVPEAANFPWVHRGSPASEPLRMPSHYHLGPASAFQLLSPRALGGPHDYLGEDNYWETLLAFGLAPMLLGLAGLARRDGARPWGWLALVLVSIWFAAGRDLGLYRLLYWSIPALRWFRVPARALFLASLGVAMLAAHGQESLRGNLAASSSWRRFSGRLGWFSLVVAGVLVALGEACPGPALSFTGRGSRWDAPRSAAGSSVNALSRGDLPHLSEFARIHQAALNVLRDELFWWTAGALAVVLVAGRIARQDETRRRLASLLGLIALVELAVHGSSLIRVAPAERFFGSDPVGEALILVDPVRPADQPLRVRARDTFYLDLQAVCYGIEKTNRNDWFQIAHAAALYEPLYSMGGRTAPPSRLAAAPERAGTPCSRLRQSVCDRMAVAYLVSNRIEVETDWPIVARGTRGDEEFVIQRNPTAMPRAYVVPRAEVVPDERAAVLDALVRTNPREVVVMSEDPLAGLPPSPRAAFREAVWRSRDPDRPILEVTTTAPGLLVMADTWMPGWSASVNGVPVEVLRGNLAHRVIPLKSAGEHRVVLQYLPPGLPLGCSITASLIATWVIMAAICRRKKPPMERFSSLRLDTAGPTSYRVRRPRHVS